MNFKRRIPAPSTTRFVWRGAWGVWPWTRRSPPRSVQRQQYPSQRMRLDIGPHVWQDWFQPNWRWSVPQACKSSFGISHICICFVALKVYKELERMLKVSEIKMSVDKVLVLAKTITTIQIKLPLNKEVYTQTMLMARHQKIAKLFDEEFWVTRWQSQKKCVVWLIIRQKKCIFLTSSLKKHTFYNLLINNILYLCVT